MLIIDAAEFDEMELLGVISKQCSELGSVMGVKIWRINDPYRYDLAIVEMSSDDEASEVATELGGQGYGSSVVMQILHRGKLLRGHQTLH